VKDLTGIAGFTSVLVFIGMMVFVVESFQGDKIL